MKRKKYSDLKNLFKDYQSGAISGEYKKIIDDWFNLYKNEQSQSVFNSEQDEERIYQELSSKLKENIYRKSPVVKMPYMRILKIACVLILTALSATMVILYLKPAEIKKEISFTRISTGLGEQKRVLLADGSEVWLNAASEIRFSKAFNKSDRRVVYLDSGEAYFRVKRDTLHPFDVVTGNMVTKVVGTSFNIRAYDPLNSYKVAVTSGQVGVEMLNEDGSSNVLSSKMEKNTVLTYDYKKKVALEESKDAAAISSWTEDGSLYFDEMTLTEIGAELSRRFKLNVTVSNPESDSKKYNLKILRKSIVRLLEELAIRTGISYELSNQTLVIHPKIKKL